MQWLGKTRIEYLLKRNMVDNDDGCPSLCCWILRGLTKRKFPFFPPSGRHIYIIHFYIYILPTFRFQTTSVRNMERVMWSKATRLSWLCSRLECVCTGRSFVVVMCENRTRFQTSYTKLSINSPFSMMANAPRHHSSLSFVERRQLKLLSPISVSLCCYMCVWGYVVCVESFVYTWSIYRTSTWLYFWCSFDRALSRAECFRLYVRSSMREGDDIRCSGEKVFEPNSPSLSELLQNNIWCFCIIVIGEYNWSFRSICVLIICLKLLLKNTLLVTKCYCLKIWNLNECKYLKKLSITKKINRIFFIATYLNVCKKIT